jgi:acyl-CoA thioesterase I
MIGPEFAIAVQLAQEQTSLRIVTLGTSLTARGGWQGPLGDQLTRCLAKPVDVVNHGKSGANSRWGVGEVATVAAARPDIVLIEFSANDATLHGGLSLAASRDNITSIVNGLRAQRADVRIVLMAMNPMNGLHGVMRPALDTYYDLYRDLAATLRVEFIDHRPAWQRLEAHALEAAIPDGVHPKEREAAEIIAPTLARAICGPQHAGSPT